MEEVGRKEYLEPENIWFVKQRERGKYIINYDISLPFLQLWFNPIRPKKPLISSVEHAYYTVTALSHIYYSI